MKVKSKTQKQLGGARNLGCGIWRGETCRGYCGDKQQGFTLVELLVVIAIIGILIGMLLPAVQQVREASRRSTCSNNLRQLALSVQNFASAQSESLPYGVWAGWGYSWTAEVLPHLEQQNLYDVFLQPWSDDGWYGGSDPASVALRQIMRTPVSTFKCPSEPSGPTDPRNVNGLTDRAIGSYLACAGGNASNDDSSMRNSNGMFNAVLFVGVSRPAARKRLASVIDGLSNTVMMSEATHLNDSPFLADRFLFFHPDADTGNGGDFSEALGSTFYPINLTHRSTNGNEVECSYSSYHSQGVNTALADGSVQFVRESIDLTIWRAYGSINGREVTEGL